MHCELTGTNNEQLFF